MSLSIERLESLSKYLSYLLRHHPETLKLKMDNNGWVSVDELLTKINAETQYSISLDELKEVVERNDKKRFAFRDNNWGLFIRAVQGHSLSSVNMKYKSVKPPKILYHGTAYRFVDSIMKSGILAMKRQYVHLSSDYDTAVSVGIRHGKVKVLIVDAEKMYNDGVEFYKSENGIWLTKFVDKKYVSICK